MSTSSNKSIVAHKRCFVVSEFGRSEQIRSERKQTVKHLVRKVLEPRGYMVQRADDIDDLGQITHQIIERLLDDELVVADLTGLNPNVFYELAVRHAARKPVITLMTVGESIPFDVKDVRTVFYDLHDPDKLEAAQQELGQKVDAIEANPNDIRNPITVARNATLLQQSDDPDIQAAGAVLSAVNELRDEMRNMFLHREATDGHGVRASSELDALRLIRELFMTSGNRSFTTEEVIQHAGSPPGWTQRRLQRLAADPNEEIFAVNGKWSSVPF